MANNPDDSFEIGGFEGQEDPFANEGRLFISSRFSRLTRIN